MKLPQPRKSRIMIPQPRARSAGVSRRNVLWGLGGICLSLPWLESQKVKSARAQIVAGGPKRIVVMAYEMGIPTSQWAPSGAGASMTLPYVTAPLENVKQRCLFVSQIDHEVLEVGGNPFVFGHPAKKEAALTGTLTTAAFPTTNTNHLSEVMQVEEADGAANGSSVEAIIGSQLHDGHLFPSVDLCVDGDAGLSTWGGPPETQTSHFFFEGRGNAVTMHAHPDKAFDALFGGLNLDGGEPTEAELELQRIRERNMSVLDAVRDSFGELRKGLGRDDQRRLDEHAALIRRLELDVRVSQTCSAPMGIPVTADWAGTKMDEMAPLMNRILTHAMTCDLAPVGRIEYLNQQNPRFGVAELDGTLDSVSDFDWHGMVHGDFVPGTSTYLRPGRGEETSYDSRLLDGYRFFVQQFADLVELFAAVPEGDAGETALDHTLLVLATDLGEGLGHGNRKMGYILAGNLGGARTGYHLNATPGSTEIPGVTNFYTASNYSVNQLLNSIADMAGATDDQGNPLEVGLQGFIQDRGVPRIIDELF